MCFNQLLVIPAGFNALHRIIIRMTNILEFLLVLIEGPDISAEPEVDFSGRRVDVSCVFLTFDGGSH